MLEFSLKDKGGMSDGGVCKAFHLSMIGSLIIMGCGDRSCVCGRLMCCAQGWCRGACISRVGGAS